ncbi:Gfo/Idh/MocA family protein [Sphingomonas sp.]|uniref:Gfo/Idh/MocA family protein n=1 Tax=Sphingomonas sp. TaxID=28214 RepID=UPI0038A00891
MTIRSAVIGLGKMGLSHLSIANALDDFEVVAACDNSKLVTAVLSKATGLKAFNDYDEVLALEALDAVLIATPSIAHEPMIRKALDRGLHVFAEKPLTLDAAASRELAELAAKKGVVGQVGYHNRYVGTFAEAARLLSGGALGKISHALAESYGPVVLRRTKPTWRGKAGQGGGCLHDYAAHPINLLNWMFGSPVGCLGASLTRHFSAEVEDQTHALLQFRDGTMGQVCVDWSDPSVRKMTTKVSIWGEAGKLYVDRTELQLFLSGKGKSPEGYREGWTIKHITDLTPPVSFYLRGEEYSAQLEAFGGAIAGRESQRNDFASAAQTDLTIEMIEHTAAAPQLAKQATPSASSPKSLLGRVFSR